MSSLKKISDISTDIALYAILILVPITAIAIWIGIPIIVYLYGMSDRHLWGIGFMVVMWGIPLVILTGLGLIFLCARSGNEQNS